MIGRSLERAEHRMRARLCLFVVLAGSAAGFAATAAVAAAGSQRPSTHAAAGRCPHLLLARTERVDVGADGSQAQTRVLRASISADGRYVAFSSASPALVPGDENGSADVFVRDLWKSRTTRVSVSSTGAEGDAASFFPSISGDGRFVAFRSFARNLVADDRNGVEDVFVHDRTTGVTERVSVASDGSEATGPSITSAISGDGRFVAFTSSASNLVPGDRNHAMDVFVRDRDRHQTWRVSVGPYGEANGASEGSGISRDGHDVVFRSSATNLVGGDTNGRPDVFVRDWVAGTTTRVNVSSTGEEANLETYRGSISGDGRWVAFRSEASNLVPGDTNGAQDVFEHDRGSNETTRISVSTAGSQAWAPPPRRTGPGHKFMSRAFLSRTGRFAAFGSYASNLVDGDTNGASDVFLHDLRTHRTIRVSVGARGVQANGDSFVMGISRDGAVVLFVSAATNLVPGDTNSRRDAFVRIRRLCVRQAVRTP